MYNPLLNKNGSPFLNKVTQSYFSLKAKIYFLKIIKFQKFLSNKNKTKVSFSVFLKYVEILFPKTWLIYNLFL